MKLLLTLLFLTLTMDAVAELVVVGHPNSQPMTKEQIAAVYLGRSGMAAPLDQPESSSAKREFYAKATGRDVASVKATWSRLVFTGKGRPPKELADAEAIKREIAANPKAIGYMDSSAVDGSVKVLLRVE